MADFKNVTKVPFAKPGMDALEVTAPVLVQMNPEGKWENCMPKNMDEERLKAVVQHLVNSDAVSAVQSYCCQCAAGSQVHITILNSKTQTRKGTNLSEATARLVYENYKGSASLRLGSPLEKQKQYYHTNENKNSNYVPVIMMPIYAADQCPFDLECEVQKVKESETKAVKKINEKEQEKQSEKEKDKKKIKKRTFVLQRLTDFDLLSQW